MSLRDAELPTPEPIIPSAPDAITFAILSSYERKGVIVMAAAGVCSCTIVSSLLLYIIFSAISPWKKRDPDAPLPFIRKQIAVFVVCLLVADLIQSIAGVTQVKWAAENSIYSGRACNIQAAALVMGDLASTVWSCVIAFHTFYTLALAKQWPRPVVYVVLVIGWSIPIVLTTIGPTTLATVEKGPFFGIAGTWCFIASAYAIPRLGIHYVPMFVGSVIIIVFYGMVFFVIRGNLNFRRPDPTISPVSMDSVFSRERVAIAKRMLWYPVAYLTCALPIAIVRLIGLSSKIVPDSVWIFGMVFLFLLGSADSVIYATTRSMIKPMRFPKSRRTFSEFSSEGVISSSIPRKSLIIERGDMLKYLDYNPDPSRLGMDDGDSTRSRGAESDSEKRRGVIHVTLERIQEVI